MMATTADEIEAEISSTFESLPGPIPIDDVTTSDEFRDFNNNPEGIRAPHAVDALQAAAAAGSFERFDLGAGAWLGLALAPVAIGKAYTMLLHIVGRPNAEPNIAGAWRLYDLAPDVTPTHAFAMFVAENGHEFSVGSVHGRFIGKRITGPGEPGLGFSGPQGAEFRASAMAMRKMSGEMDWSWCFAIDPQRYRAYVRAHR